MPIIAPQQPVSEVARNLSVQIWNVSHTLRSASHRTLHSTIRPTESSRRDGPSGEELDTFNLLWDRLRAAYRATEQDFLEEGEELTANMARRANGVAKLLAEVVQQTRAVGVETLIFNFDIYDDLNVSLVLRDAMAGAILRVSHYGDVFRVSHLNLEKSPILDRLGNAVSQKVP